jgi:hypothetical protein
MEKACNAWAARAVEKYAFTNLLQLVGNAVVREQQFGTEAQFNAQDVVALDILGDNEYHLTFL